MSMFEEVQPFSCDRFDDLERFRPRVLVGSAADVRRMAELAERQIIDLASVDHAVFVLTQCGDQPLSDVCRVVLWQTFGVPVYELYVGAQGAVLAFECEAHESWHVEAGAKFTMMDGELVVEAGGVTAPTGLTADLEDEICACGRAGVRLTNVRALILISDDQILAATA